MRVSPQIPEYRLFRMLTNHCHIMLHTFCMSLAFPPPTFHTCHLHISTDRHPIIYTLMLQMPKPPKSAMPHHICHTPVYPKDCTIPHCAFYPSATLFTSISPSLLRPILAMQIFNLHRPCFGLICQPTLDTSSVYLFLYVVWCTTSSGVTRVKGQPGQPGQLTNIINVT